MNTRKIFYESLQTGLGMAQQLPTNVTYDGELDDLYNSDDEEEFTKFCQRHETEIKQLILDIYESGK